MGVNNQRRPAVELSNPMSVDDSSPISSTPSNLTINSLLALLSAQLYTSTVKTVHSAIRSNCNIAITKILYNIKSNSLDIQNYLEFVIFPLVVLKSMPFGEARKIRGRNRGIAQRDYTMHRLQLWNENKTLVINSTLDPPENADRNLQPHFTASNNLRRAEHLARNNGQYGKAVKSLLSGGIAPVNQEIINILDSKHPSAPLPSIKELPVGASFSVQPKQVLKQLHSFSKGSAGGRSGWRVGHFLELCQFQEFLTLFTDVINLFLSARVPLEINQLLVSGKLVPILKKDGGIRPVVVGEVFRRLLSKLCVAHIYYDSLEYLQPLQLGVGVKAKVDRRQCCMHLIESFANQIQRILKKFWR